MIRTKTISLSLILALFCSHVFHASTICALAQVQAGDAGLEKQPFTVPKGPQPGVQPGKAQPDVQPGQAQEETGVQSGDSEVEKQPSMLTNPDLELGHAGVVNMTDQKFTFLSDRVQVDVMNGLPPNSQPLIVHCKSRNDDFGNHTLTRWSYFYWRFRPAFFASTLYWCNWYWGSKHSGFVVYDDRSGFADGQCIVETKDKKTNEKKTTNICHWQARADGFYWTKYLGIVHKQNSPHWEKRHDWDK